MQEGRKTMNFNTYETAQTLFKLAGYEEDNEIFSEIEEALYYLECAAKNPYNKSYFLTLCKTLHQITENER